jgi:hypothetical protein
MVRALELGRLRVEQLVIDLGAFIALLWPAVIPLLGGALALVLLLSILAPFRALAERG